MHKMIYFDKNDKVVFRVRVLQIFEFPFYKFSSPRFTNFWGRVLQTFESAFYKFLSPRLTNFWVRVSQVQSSPRFTSPVKPAFYKSSPVRILQYAPAHEPAKLSYSAKSQAHCVSVWITVSSIRLHVIYDAHTLQRVGFTWPGWKR